MRTTRPAHVLCEMEGLVSKPGNDANGVAILVHRGKVRHVQLYPPFQSLQLFAENREIGRVWSVVGLEERTDAIDEKVMVHPCVVVAGIELSTFCNEGELGFEDMRWRKFRRVEAFK